MDEKLGKSEGASFPKAAQVVKVVISREATADLNRLSAFLSEHNEAVAARAVVALIDAIESLERLPERGRPSGIPGMRELIVPFGRSAYVLRYMHLADENDVIILRIWHGREMR